MVCVLHPVSLLAGDLCTRKEHKDAAAAAAAVCMCVYVLLGGLRKLHVLCHCREQKLMYYQMCVFGRLELGM